MHPLKVKMIDKITDMPSEMVEVVDKHFWELIDSPQAAPEAGSECMNLLSCAHCGGEAVLEGEGGKYFVICNGCDIGTTVWLDEGTATRMWNNRAT